MPQAAVSQFRPLRWPGGKKPPEWFAVYWAFYAAVVGGFVAAVWRSNAAWMGIAMPAVVGVVVFHHRKNRTTVERLGEQLADRRSFPADAWGAGGRAAFAEAAGRIVADEIGWPNPHFLPDDPLEVVLYCPAGDGGEGLAIGDELEKAFGRRCTFGGSRTFGEFVDGNLAPGEA